MGYLETLQKIYKFYKYCEINYKIQIYVIMCTVVLTAITLLDPLIYKFAVDEFLLNKNKGAFIILIILYLSKTIFFNIFKIAKEYLQLYMGFFLALKLRRVIFEKILNIKSIEEKKIDLGEVFVSFDNDVFEIETKMTIYIFEVFLYCFQVIGIGIIMFILSWQYFLVILFLRITLLTFNNKFWIGYLKKGLERNKTNNSIVLGFLSEVANNIKSIKVMSKEKYMEKTFFNKVNVLAKSQVKYKSLTWLSTISEELLYNFDRIILWGLGGYLFNAKIINIGTYLAIILYEELLKIALQHILSLNVKFYTTIVAIERIEKIFNLTKEELSGKKIKKLKGEFEFKNIDFFYENEEEKVFENFNLKIKAGEKIAIVGESGSGKTSLINLMLGLYIPNSGSILVDNINVHENLAIRSYRKRIGIVSQEPFFFKGSIRDNLLFGDKISKERLDEICEVSQMTKFIEENEEGIDMELETNASNLSGGQKQRLSIARMLIRNPDIVILDEATSALDNITEAKIQEALEKELKNKTVIMIAHRLSTIKNADRIIVLEAGKIIEEGTHEELVSNKNYYYKLLHKKGKEDAKVILT